MVDMYQLELKLSESFVSVSKRKRPKGQLLKWIGNKYRHAEIIANLFPEEYNRYIEPFVGTGAVLATLAPHRGIAGDILKPLINFWNLVKTNSYKLYEYYKKVISQYNLNPKETYDLIRKRYNTNPNPYDLLIISRTCYGGVIRFTKEGKISTPVGPHKPISPETFKKRLLEWSKRIQNTIFLCQSFEKTMELVEEGDIVYCDPPYIDSQSILYGSQSFNFNELIDVIYECKKKGAKIILSIDGKKKSGKRTIELKIPKGIFERIYYLDCGCSMLKRFQCKGEIMLGEEVADRLMLTW